MHKIKCILETNCDFIEEEQKLFFGLKFKIHFAIELAFKIIYFSQLI